MFQAGDLVLCFDPQLKPGEANKFHRQAEGPYEIAGHGCYILCDEGRGT